MGVIEKDERKLTELDVDGVKRLLQNRHHDANRRLIADLHGAIESAGLTDDETFAIACVDGANADYFALARRTGTPISTLKQHRTSACVKLASWFAARRLRADGRA